MQLDERVRLQPVATDAVPAVDQGHAHIGSVVDQRVRERHPHGAGAHHEVVGLDAAGHGDTVLDDGQKSAEEHVASGLDTVDGDRWVADVGPPLRSETQSIGHQDLVAPCVLGDPVRSIAQLAGDAL